MSQPVPYSSLFDSEGIVAEANVSLPAVLSNMMLLVDYVATNSTVPTPWPWGVWEQFTPQEREARARISPPLVHGLILQEHWLNTIPADHEANRDWTVLRQMVKDSSDEEIRRLLAEGWVSGTEFYLKEMVATDAMDAFLPENAASITVDQLMADPALFDSLHAFTYVSWGVPEGNLSEYVGFAQDPAAVREALLLVLDAVWRHGGEEQWLRSQPRLEAWSAQADERIRAGHWSDALDAVRDLTGRMPPERLQPAVRRARRLVLLPVLQFSTVQTVHTDGDTAYVMFEPSTSRASHDIMAIDSMKLADAVSLVRAMSDPAAFTLLQTLANAEERYALELAEESGIHQSTVSRHLGVLERNGIVAVRREGKAKYYQLRQDKIELAMRVIREALTD